jgi:hypothetical protein
MPLPEFQWVRAQFADVLQRFEPGRYIERVHFQWRASVFGVPTAQKLLFQLTQADGWVVEHVSWGEFEGHLGMKACTLIRTPRQDCP